MEHCKSQNKPTGHTKTTEKVSIEVISKKHLQAFEHLFHNSIDLCYLCLIKIFIYLKKDFCHEIMSKMVLPHLFLCFFVSLFLCYFAYFECKQLYESDVFLIFVEMHKNNCWLQDELSTVLNCVRWNIEKDEKKILTTFWTSSQKRNNMSLEISWQLFSIILRQIKTNIMNCLQITLSTSFFFQLLIQIQMIWILFLMIIIYDHIYFVKYFFFKKINLFQFQLQTFWKLIKIKKLIKLIERIGLKTILLFKFKINEQIKKAFIYHRNMNILNSNIKNYIYIYIYIFISIY